MIVLRGLSKSYGDKVAVHGLTLTIEPGEILGFLGPNGAGKTTTVKMLTGMILPTEGTAEVAGFDILKQPLEVKKRIGYVPETAALYESLTAWEYLTLVGHLHHLDQETLEKRAGEFLELFGLYEVKDQRIAEYSKGMKQKVLISAALLHNPMVLFLDEPLSGLDANAALVFKELLKRLSAQGKTIFFCSHILEVVERLCTRIVIIHEGRIIAQGTARQIAEASGQATLEEAFSKLTGIVDYRRSAEEFLEALAAV